MSVVEPEPLRYEDEDDVVASAAETLRTGAPYFIWRYPSGRFDWTSNPECEPRNDDPGAVLVAHAHVPGYTSATWGVEHCPLCSESAA